MGTPGGDQQDQWTLAVLLRHLHHGMDLQAAIDAPLFTSKHFPQSFYPRSFEPAACWRRSASARRRSRGWNGAGIW